MNWYRFFIILLAAAGAITVPAAYLCYRVVFTVPGAGHGLSYLIDNAGYRSAVLSFLRSVGAV